MIVVLPRPLQKLVDVVLLLVDNGLYDTFLFSGRRATYLADKLRGYKNFIVLRSLPCLALGFV